VSGSVNGKKEGGVRERHKKIKQQAGEGVEGRKGLTSHWGLAVGWRCRKWEREVNKRHQERRPSGFLSTLTPA
jgi:hypothetical protein